MGLCVSSSLNWVNRIERFRCLAKDAQQRTLHPYPVMRVSGHVRLDYRVAVAHE